MMRMMSNNTCEGGEGGGQKNGGREGGRERGREGRRKGEEYFNSLGMK